MPDVDKNKKSEIKIKILKDGPYLVSGRIPLSEMIIISRGNCNEYHQGRRFPLQEKYSLCRCGQTKKSPYCDGSHVKAGFVGKETASRADYANRAELLEGPNLDLLDDDRCAYVRFCQRGEGNAWELTENSNDPNLRQEAIKAACECPSGRLVVLEKDGTPIEPDFEPSIEILQDNPLDISGPIYVKGNIPIESEDGFTYEVRNRLALCRCGKSCNKPFCDASHVAAEYHDRV
ncbi:MAG TPA: iron-binding protein [Clostridiales bacterium]|nr:iron-binding protein [Clostridiales bacterium]